MTHSGGKPHAVGDRGQRYEVTVLDETSGERIVLGWTNNLGAAQQMASAACRRPTWTDGQVRERQAKP